MFFEICYNNSLNRILRIERIKRIKNFKIIKLYKKEFLNPLYPLYPSNPVQIIFLNKRKFFETIFTAFQPLLDLELIYKFEIIYLLILQSI